MTVEAAQNKDRIVKNYSIAAQIGVHGVAPLIVGAIVSYALPNESMPVSVPGISAGFLLAGTGIVCAEKINEFSKNFGEVMYQRFHAPKKKSPQP